jgi:hypothetical protein
MNLKQSLFILLAVVFFFYAAILPFSMFGTPYMIGAACFTLYCSRKAKND